jgi:hypothetical protein
LEVKRLNEDLVHVRLFSEAGSLDEDVGATAKGGPVNAIGRIGRESSASLRLELLFFESNTLEEINGAVSSMH